MNDPFSRGAFRSTQGWRRASVCEDGGRRDRSVLPGGTGDSSTVWEGAGMPALRRVLCLIGLGAASLVWAGPGEVVATVTHLSGVMSIKPVSGPSRLGAVKSGIHEGDLLVTEADSYARIKFADNSEIVLRPETHFAVTSYSFNPAVPEADNFASRLLKGGIRAVTGLLGKRNRDRVTYETITATIGIRGTHFGALLCQADCAGIPTPGGRPPENGLHVDVADGAVRLSNSAGAVIVGAGQFGHVASPSAMPLVVPPQQGVPVTMPAAIAANKGTGKAIDKAGNSECAL